MNQTVDFSYFDALIDAVFVLNEQKGVVYCNESAAQLFESSVKRLLRGKPIYEWAEFANQDLFVTKSGQAGAKEPLPMQEIEFKLLHSEKNGRVQIAIQPFSAAGAPLWLVLIHDVTVEAVLHAKHHAQLKQLEEYSKNLEKMVEERTLELRKANSMLSATMNSLGQGFLVFDAKGICSNFYTRACEDILECQPAQKNISEVLKLTNHEIQSFEMWREALILEQLPFETMKSLGPAKFNHSQGRNVELDYYPIRDEKNKIEKVVLVATDTTSEYLAHKALEEEKKYAKMVLKLISSRKPFAAFIKSIPETTSECCRLIDAAMVNIASFDIETSFRVLHTLEGEAAIYSADKIWQASRHAQEVIEPVKKKQSVLTLDILQQYQSKIDLLNSSYNEFIEQNKELFNITKILGPEVLEFSAVHIKKVIEDLTKKGVPEFVIKILEDEFLCVEIRDLLLHYNDMAQVVAEKLNKKIKPLQFIGETVKVNPTRFEALFSTFVHAIRNSIDHGIESSEDREMMGKEKEGQITISSSQYKKLNRSWLKIVISDDGQGIDPERIKRKALELDPSSSVIAMPADEILQMVFNPGLSTKSEVGEFSGRGIGLNALKVEAEVLGGSVRAFSDLGAGTRFEIDVPLENEQLFAKAS